MSRRITISRHTLGYRGGLVLHTATSGAVPVLYELRLRIEDDGRLTALGATRTNIAYLVNASEAEIEAAVLSAAATVQWALRWHDMLVHLDAALPALMAPARMLFEMAIADGAARGAGLALAVSLGAGPDADLSATESNQTLFWQDDSSLLQRAHGHVARGFRQLKLRIGVAGIDDDLRRLALLRRTFGASLRLSADANGCWDVESAPRNLEAMAALGLEYIEQPLPAEAWEETARLSQSSPVPIMLDEALSSMAAVARLAKTRAAPLAHLKLAKLGGLDRLIAAARQLSDAGIGVMVGQMNEGAISTLAAAHAAIAIGAPLRELYGADQIEGEPAEPALCYQGGVLEIPSGPGISLLQPQPLPSQLLFEENVT